MGQFPLFWIRLECYERIIYERIYNHIQFENRGGWGATGNDKIPAYSALGLLTQAAYTYGTTGSFPVFTLGNPASPNITWERSKQTDIGLDIGFFKDRLTFSADYYNKTTTDMLLSAKIPYYEGGGTNLINVGKVNNRGVELSFSALPIVSKDFKWQADFNISFNRNKVLSLGSDSILFRNNFTSGLFTENIQAIAVGKPLGAFYLIPYLGIYQTDDPVLGFKAGDNKYKDVNGDHVIDDKDQTLVGNPTPKVTMGFTNTFTYKNFSLSIFLQGAYGFDVYNLTYASTVIPSSDIPYQTNKDVANYWTPQNTGGTIATLGSKTNRNYFQSTQFLQSGDYTRLKNISLAYTFSKPIIPGFKSATIAVSAQNLATITKYKGFDPEASSTSPTSDGDAGIDYGAYPPAKSFTFRLNLNF